MAKLICMALLTLAVAACASIDATDDDFFSTLDMSNPRSVDATLLTGGQPSIEDLEKLKANGIDVVVNLRTPSEQLGFDEGREFAALGMTYVHIPVGVPDGLSKANAEDLDRVLSESEGGVFVHCRSGNRAGALLALWSFYVEGEDLEDSLDLGRRAGMTQIEPQVREILQAADQAPN